MSDYGAIPDHPSVYFAVCMAFDAFRMALGKPTLQFTSGQVVAWLRAMSGVQDV